MTVFAYTLHKRFGGGRWTPRIVELLANGAQQAAGGIVRRIDVQLRWNAGSLQSEVHEHALLRAADDIVPAVHEEDRGCPGRDAEARSELILVLRLQIA